jgi:hypothetical protein
MQNAEKFNQFSSTKTWLEALKEYDRIVAMNVRNNHLAGVILMEAYYAAAIMIDVSIYMTINGKRDIAGQALCFLFASYTTLFAFIVTFIGTLLVKTAYLPYLKLNSFMARLSLKRRIWFRLRFPIYLRLNIINTIERIAGPKIAVYCLDWFPLTQYQFYLYTAGVFMNYLLITNLIKASRW